MLIALWVPVVLLTMGIAVLLAGSTSSWRQAAQARDMIELATALDNFDRALDTESRAAVALPGTGFDQAVAASDARLAELTDAIARVREVMPVALGSYVDQLLAQNPKTRAALRAAARSEADPISILDGYEQMRTALAQAPDRLAAELSDRTLAARLDLLVDVSSWRIALATERDLTALSTSPAISSILPAAIQATDHAAEKAQNTAGRLGLGAPVWTSAAAGTRAHIRAATAATVTPMTSTERRDLSAAQTELEDSLVSMQHQATSSAESAASGALRAAALETVALLVLALAIVALAGFGGPRVVRRALEPLERLVTQTEARVSSLPAIIEAAQQEDSPVDHRITPLAVDGHEVGRVARYVDQLVAAVVRSAAEQARARATLATSLATVARRESILIDRQLSLLDQFERTEEDPVILARLFKLDHLATQMRRLAQSLLILSGGRTTQVSRAPMPLVDIVRAGVSQIEQYPRVDVHSTIDPLVHAHRAGDLTHLFTELLDNATRFSDPSTRVSVTLSGDNGVQVLIRDHGLGMDDATLDRAAAILAHDEHSPTVSLDRLGLHVVARLKERAGADVYVTRAQAGSGTVALVTIASSSLVATSPVAQMPIVSPVPRSKPTGGHLATADGARPASSPSAATRTSASAVRTAVRTLYGHTRLAWHPTHEGR